MKRWPGLVLLLAAMAWGQQQPVRTVAEGVRTVTVSDNRQEMAFYDGADLQVYDNVGVVRQSHWVSVGAPRWLRFAPDTQTLVAGLNEDRLVAFTRSGQRRWAFRTDGVPEPVAFSADSKVLAVALPDHHGVDLLDCASGQLVGAVTHHTARLTGFAFSPAAPRLALGWDDGELDLTDETGKPGETLHGSGPISGLAWRPDGHGMLLGEGRSTRLRTGPTLEPTLVFDTDEWHLTPASWSPGGTHFALYHFRAPTSFGLSIHELPSGRAMRYDETTDRVGVDWSPDDHLMAVTTGRVRVYRLIDGEPAYTAPDFNTHQAWFAPAGHRMLVWTWAGSLKVWDF